MNKETIKHLEKELEKLEKEYNELVADYNTLLDHRASLRETISSTNSKKLIQLANENLGETNKLLSEIESKCNRIKLQYDEIASLIKSNKENIKRDEEEAYSYKGTGRSVIKPKESKKTLFQKIGAVVLAGGVLLSDYLVGARDAASKLEKNRAEKNITEEYNNDFVTQLLNKLDKNQQEAWAGINEFQKHFNSVAAPTVKIPEDNDKQFYLTAEESLALFVRLNANRYTASELAHIMGTKSDFATYKNLDINYINACRILSYYYFTATAPSGLDKLFVNEEDANLFRETEKLILQYNQDISNIDNRKLLHDNIMNMFFNGSIGNALEKNTGVLAAIGPAYTPSGYLLKVFSPEEFEKIIEMYETASCDRQAGLVNEATTNITDPTPNQEILLLLPEALDKQNINVNSREIDLSQRYINVFFKNPIYMLIPRGVSIEIDRQNASRIYGEDALKDAEIKAQEVINQYNQSKIDYINGASSVANSNLYDYAYNQALNGEQIVVTNTPTGNVNYDQGVNDATQIIINHAKQKAQEERNHQQEGNHEQTVTKEDYVSEDDADYKRILGIG